MCCVCLHRLDVLQTLATVTSTILHSTSTFICVCVCFCICVSSYIRIRPPARAAGSTLGGTCTYLYCTLPVFLRLPSHVHSTPRRHKCLPDLQSRQYSPYHTCTCYEYSTHPRATLRRGWYNGQIWQISHLNLALHTMFIRDARKRVLRQLNSRYIYGRYPLLHAIIALVQITMVSILVRKFNAYYANRPVLTTMITNAVRLPSPTRLAVRLGIDSCA